MIKKILVTFLSIVLLAGCAASNSDTSEAPASSASPEEIKLEPLTVSGVTISGSTNKTPVIEIQNLGESVTQLVVADQVVGQGESVPAGATVLAHYVGYGLTTGQKFDSSWDRGNPIEFGLDQVIPGWTQGVPGMKIGGRRILVIPAELAYGQNPPPGSGIEPGESLIFVIDLIDFI